MGEMLEYGQFYIKTETGDFVKINLDGDILIRDEIDEETYNSLSQEGIISPDEFTIYGTIRRRDHRKLLRHIRALFNNRRRSIRRYYRMKEKARRNKLKGL